MAIVRCDNLVKRYGSIRALNNVTLSVEPGVVGLLGPNGAGKSTLLSVLLGHTPRSGGRAWVLDMDTRTKQRAIRRRIGFMPENECLIAGQTGTSYVVYAGRLAGMSFSDAMQRAHEVLDYVALEEARYRPAEEYSTGMKQRLKLAQALVHDPDLLFLDEPTNGMDPQGRQIMLSLISDLGKAGISVLLSSHLLPDVEKVCERVIIMGGGEVLTQGVLDDLNRPSETLYTLDFVGDRSSLVDELTRRNIAILGKDKPDNRESTGQIAIELATVGSQQDVFRAAEDANAELRGLHPKRSSLEETFMAAIRKQDT